MILMTARLRNSFIGFILIINTIYSKGAFAQYLNFNAGMSTATGDFGSTDLSNAKAGYGGVGVNFNANFILNHDKSLFAIACQFFYNQNDFKVDELEKQFNSIFGPSLSAQLKLPSNTYYTFSSLQSWNSSGGLLGLYIYTSKSSDIKGFGRAMIGKQSANSFSYSINGPNAFGKQLSNNVLTTIYLFGGGVQFASNEKVSFKVGVDYLMSNPDYGTENFGNGFSGNKMDYPFSVINVTIGMEIRLHHPEATLNKPNLNKF